MDLNWKAQALCLDSYPDLDFFDLSDPRIATQLLDLCDKCPVWSECLDLGLEMSATAGLFGGVIFEKKPSALRQKIESTIIRREQRLSGTGVV